MIHIIHLAREEAQILEGCHFLAHPVELRTSTTVTRAFVRVPAPISQLNVTCSRQRMRWTDGLHGEDATVADAWCEIRRHLVVSLSIYQSTTPVKLSAEAPSLDISASRNLGNDARASVHATLSRPTTECSV